MDDVQLFGFGQQRFGNLDVEIFIKPVWVVWFGGRQARAGYTSASSRPKMPNRVPFGLYSRVSNETWVSLVPDT